MNSYIKALSIIWLVLVLLIKPIVTIRTLVSVQIALFNSRLILDSERELSMTR